MTQFLVVDQDGGRGGEGGLEVEKASSLNIKLFWEKGACWPPILDWRREDPSDDLSLTFENAEAFAKDRKTFSQLSVTRKRLNLAYWERR